jgi:hypothetical protein
MATISREAALAMIAQVERQTGVMTRRYTGNEVILDRFADFRAFIDALSEFHLFIDMVENRLGAFGPGDRTAQERKLATIRAGILALELETTSQFLDRMVTHDRPWPMGSQKFLRRRLTRLDDIAGFHAAQGADYELVPPDAALMQNIRDRVAGQIDNSVPLADFGAAPPLPEALPPDEPVAEMLTPEAPPPVVVEPPPAQQPEFLAPDDQVFEIPKAPESPPTAPLPAPPPMPDVMIPGMMTFAPSVPKPSTSPSSGPAAAPIPKPPVSAPALPDFVIPGMTLPEAPPPSPPPAPSASEPVPSRPVSELPPVPPLEGEDFDTDYVSQKAKAVAQLAAKSAAQVPAGAKKPAPQGMARRDFRLKVRNEADGYKYIEGNGLAVMTEVCRIANITIDDLAKTLELSRPGLVLILNGRDPVSTELLKTLRRLVLRTGGLS